jgi:hypothetical protein
MSDEQLTTVDAVLVSDETDAETTELRTSHGAVLTLTASSSPEGALDADDDDDADEAPVEHVVQLGRESAKSDAFDSSNLRKVFIILSTN